MKLSNTQQVTIYQEQRTLKSSVKLFLSFNETSQTFALKMKFLGKMFLMKIERLENVKLGAVFVLILLWSEALKLTVNRSFIYTCMWTSACVNQVYSAEEKGLESFKK